MNTQTLLEASKLAAQGLGVVLAYVGLVAVLLYPAIQASGFGA